MEMKLEELKGSNSDFNKLSTDSEQYKKYTEMLDQMESMDDHLMRKEETEEQEQSIKDEMKEVDNLFKSERKIKDAFYNKREQKRSMRKSGGVRSDSPMWDEED